jgi:hypothetical protein
MAGRPPDILKAILIFNEISPAIGLRVSLKKTTFWRLPSCRGSSPPEFDITSLGIPEVMENGFLLLEVPVGLPDFCTAAVKNRIGKCAALMEQTQRSRGPQIQFGLVRSCLGFPKFAYCLRSCDPVILKDVYATFDEAQCPALSDCIGTQICTDDDRWHHASLPWEPKRLGTLFCGLYCISTPDRGAFEENAWRWHFSTTRAMSLLSNATANATTPLDYPLSVTTANQKAVSQGRRESPLSAC